MTDNTSRPEWVPPEGGREFACYVRPGVNNPGGDLSRGDSGTQRRRVLKAEDYIEGILRGNRTLLARGITLIESNKAEHTALAQEVLTGVMEQTGCSLRVGITGVPGVGKSTFIEALGTRLCREGKKVAVLAVDPSSSVSGGSVLGDKTRMEQLSREPNAFIRPSPAGGNLGGVGRKSRETVLLCEAAGFDILMVETVGVGQSEIEVHSMVDCFVLLMLAGAGDELQGIKRGIVELADLVMVTKADGDNLLRARTARGELERVLHVLSHEAPDWQVPALLVSVKEEKTLKVCWEVLMGFCAKGKENGYFEERRRRQILNWVRFLCQEELRLSFERDPQVSAVRGSIEKDVVSGKMPHLLAVQQLLQNFRYPRT